MQVVQVLISLAMPVLLLVAAVKSWRRRRRGRSTGLDVYGARSPGGGRMFVRNVYGGPPSVEEYVPADILGATARQRRRRRSRRPPG